jgi:signal transduction histidine kinase
MALGSEAVSEALPKDLFKSPDLLALPRIGIAAAMAVFLVVKPTSANPGYAELLALLVVLLLAASGIIHMLTHVWETRKGAFLAFGAVGVVAFTFLYGVDAHSYLLTVFWVVAEGTLLMGLPLALSVWSAMSAGYVIGELWSAPPSSTLGSSFAFQVAGTGAVLVVAGSLTAAAYAVRSAQRDRALASRLEELDEIKNGFLQAVSHELRTPLASIVGYSLLLHDKGHRLTDGQRSQALSELSSSAKKLNRLVVDLLDVDRLSRGVVEPQRAMVDLADLIRRVLAENPPRDHPVHAELAPLNADLDGSKVERIVENLLSNAAKYTPPGTPIAIRTAPRGDGVEIAVEDRGEGVPEELKSIIFEAFSRGTQARLYAPGVGIGLSLVARFARLHGGRAWVEDRPGGGSRFRVWLPADYETGRALQNA